MDLNDLIKNPEQIQNLIQVLQALLPKENKEEKVETKTNTNTVMKTKSRKRSIGPSGSSNNAFDKMAEFNMHREDVLIDKALSISPPVARNRDFEMITVVCRICGKNETVNPSLVVDSVSRYKCNNCSRQAG